MNFEVDELGRPVLPDQAPAFVRLSGGVLHALVRASSEEVFETMALAVGLMETTEEGNNVPAPGVTIHVMGRHVITPGTYDAEGNELTAPVYDDRCHANFWLSPEVVARGNWVGFCQQWSDNGVTAAANKSEVGKNHQGIDLIDPTTVTSPSNVLL